MKDRSSPLAILTSILQGVDTLHRLTAAMGRHRREGPRRLPDGLRQLFAFKEGGDDVEDVLARGFVDGLMVAPGEAVGHDEFRFLEIAADAMGK